MKVGILFFRKDRAKWFAILFFITSMKCRNLSTILSSYLTEKNDEPKLIIKISTHSNISYIHPLLTIRCKFVFLLV